MKYYFVITLSKQTRMGRTLNYLKITFIAIALIFLVILYGELSAINKKIIDSTSKTSIVSSDSTSMYVLYEIGKKKIFSR